MRQFLQRLPTAPRTPQHRPLDHRRKHHAEYSPRHQRGTPPTVGDNRRRPIRPLDRPDPGLERVAKANGFSLHAGVSCEGHQKDKRERLCRYIARPAVAIPRLSLSSTGKVVYTLKTPYRDGTTQVAFDPVDFIARLAALVPKPRVNLTRYHGVLAPNHRWRGMVTPAKRGKGTEDDRQCGSKLTRRTCMPR